MLPLALSIALVASPALAGDEEACDFVDDDLDGVVDEGHDSNGNGIPDCLDWYSWCTETSDGMVCTEGCTGEDDDGDGLVDEGHDLDGDGVPDCQQTADPPTEPENEPPVAVCADVVIEPCDDPCASIDAGSYDPEGGSVTVTQSPGCDYSEGSTEVTLTVTDEEGASAQCDAVVEVLGAEGPATHGGALELWPPNHKMVSLDLAACGVEVTDACAGSLDAAAVGEVVSISSDEPEDANGNGDGRTTDDMVLLGGSAFEVRAERAGRENGRVYTVTYLVWDEAGAATEGTCQVSVPHDRSGDPAVDDGAAQGYTIP